MQIGKNMVRKWWHDKVVYQIYPKSFYDSNDDGIGDLQGIIKKLDYLNQLGVDILWLSPVFCSPLADQGYDISDYYNIDPRFGTMEDMDELIAEAKKRNIYILMDLVVNHCSDEHEWFQNAILDPTGKYGDYFYIRKSNDLPTNWRSYFGGAAWDKLPGHEEFYYLHVFHKKQPDLNWENQEVREEIYKMVNWWLEKGLGGFRIDAIINIKKPEVLHDYEPDREDGLSKVQNMLEEAVGVGVFLKELRDKAFQPHDAFTVGEVFDIKEEVVPEFISEKGYFSSIFDFSTTIIGNSEKGWYDRKDVEPEQYIEAIYRSQENVKQTGFLSNIIENHDEPRGVSRYISKGDGTVKGKKMLALVTMFLRGIPFVYQGQEIGMENMEFTSPDQFDDISTLDEYKVAKEAGLSDEEALKAVSKYSRDNARTPMQWSNDKYAGFTKGIPWIVVNPKYESINVKNQVTDQDSLLSFYKNLIKLRKEENYKDTFVYGEFIPYSNAKEQVMAFLRKDTINTIMVVGNFSTEEKILVLPSEIKKILVSNVDEIYVNEKEVKLLAFEAFVALL